MKAAEGETSKVKTPYEAFETIRDGYGQLTHERFIKKCPNPNMCNISHWKSGN